MTSNDPAAISPEGLAAEILRELHRLANPDNVAGMAHYGINPQGTLGVPIPAQRALATEAKRRVKLLPDGPRIRHATSQLLWDSATHEARITAGFLDDPALVTREQIEAWAADFDSWDVCDQVTFNLFDRTALAWQMAEELSARDETFVKRCGFVLMAGLAVHQKGAEHDEALAAFLPLIEREASDERNFVKKAVNWSLRQIGKRSHQLNQAAVATAERILAEQTGSPAARWVARDALRELTDDKTRSRIKR
jgi:3-methyladenine DNA glycosylase AlkD